MTAGLGARSPRRRPLQADLRDVVVGALHAGTLSDAVFDTVIQREWRGCSALHWTPVATAALAARLLVESGATRVLDVGSGVGKFCVIAALATTGATFTGVEKRPALVRESRRLARTLDVEDRVHIVEGGLDRVDPTAFDALYLFNPFAELLTSSVAERIDGAPLPDFERFFDDVATVEGWLRRAADGTRVVVVHGFGGQMPPPFACLARYAVDGDELVVWERPRGQRVARKR